MLKTIAGGYGHVLLNTIRQVEKCSSSEIEFPIVLGRDFAGEVVAKGNSVSSELMVGDSVFGVTPPHRPGCHAQYVIAHKDWVSLQFGIVSCFKNSKYHNT